MKYGREKIFYGWNQRDFENWNGLIIALDIGGVCVQLGFDSTYQALGLDLRPEAIPEFRHICGLFGKGKITEAEWLVRLNHFFEGRFSETEIREAWNLVVGSSVPGMKTVLEEIYSAGYRFAFFSDTTTVHMKHFFATSDLCHLASAGIFSYDVGAYKPDDLMYEAFELKFGIPFFYTDDSRENIEAARHRGWRAELFSSPESFLKSLKTDI